MPVLNRIAALAPEMKEWRRHLHTIPELAFDLPKTSAYVAERLREFGVDEIHEGIARTGIVAIINGQGDGPTIGLRADMDALPMPEMTGADYASTHPGRMHACGHDGHTAMLLGAAKYLSETRRFKGRVALLFQPAEEDGGGGEVMVKEGVMDRFAVREVYGIHNIPDMALGHFFTNHGPLLAAVDTLTVTLTGRGGHAATPQEAVDPVIATVGMVAAIQSIVTRNLDPIEKAVISVTQIHAGTVSNVIPETAMFQATVRSFTPSVREMLKRRLHEIIEGHAAAYGVTAHIDYDWGYPATINHADQARFAAEVAREVAGDGGRGRRTTPPRWGPRISPTCWRPALAPTSISAPGRARGCITRSSTSTTRPRPMARAFFARLVERALPL